MMGNKTSFEVVRLISSGLSSLLDRVGSSQANPPLTEIQVLVDQTISHSVEEIAKPETLLALLGASFASKLTRVGFMGAVSPFVEGKAFLPFLAQKGSYAVALANESAAFAGIERGFSRLEGQPSTESFEKAWVKSAVSLGSLKFFGKVADGQNIALQHLSADLGMVSAQNLGHVFQITDAPHGTFAQQMLQAEAMNWQIKGSQALVSSLSPGFFAMERSLDLYLKNQEINFFSPKQLSPFFPQLMLGVERGPEFIGESSIVFSKGDQEGGPKGFARIFPFSRRQRPNEVLKDEADFSEAIFTSDSLDDVREIIKRVTKDKPVDMNTLKKGDYVFFYKSYSDDYQEINRFRLFFTRIDTIETRRPGDNRDWLEDDLFVIEEPFSGTDRLQFLWHGFNLLLEKPFGPIHLKGRSRVRMRHHLKKVHLPFIWRLSKDDVEAISGIDLNLTIED